MKILTIVLTDGPYISEYAEIACKLAENALKHYRVNMFLYLDAVHIPKKGQNPSFFTSAGRLFSELAEKGAVIRACARCAASRGYQAEYPTEYPAEDRIMEDKDRIIEDNNCRDYFPGIKITSLYELSDMLNKSDRVISLSR